MEHIGALAMWLQLWKLSASPVWPLLPRGTGVYFLSTVWLEELWTVVQSPLIVGEDSELVCMRLDNSSIRNAERRGILREDAAVDRDFTVVSADTFERVFRPLVADGENELKGIVVWEGLFTPKVVPERYVLRCVVRLQDGLISHETEVEGSISTEAMISKLASDLQIDSNGQISLWTSCHLIKEIDLVQLSQMKGFSKVSWLHHIAIDDQRLFATLESLLLFADVKKKPNIFVSWINKKQRKLTPLGIKNIGNTCYLNSVLQCLIHISEFCQLIASTHVTDQHSGLFEEIKNLVVTAAAEEGGVYNPERLHDQLYDGRGKEHRKQEDARETLAAIFEKIGSCFNVIETPPLFSSPSFSDEYAWLSYYSTSPAMFSEIFGGLMRTYKSYLDCKHTVSSVSRFASFSLELPTMRCFEITITHTDQNKAKTHFYLESKTPYEDVETCTTLRLQLHSQWCSSFFLLGQLRDKLFKKVSSSNLADDSAYNVLELPVNSPQEVVVMVDVFSDFEGDVKSVDTRLVSVLKTNGMLHTKEEIASYLFKVWTAYVQRHSMRSSSGLSLKRLCDQSELLLSSRDWHFQHGEVVQVGDMTIGELCERKGREELRFDFVVKKPPESFCESLTETHSAQAAFFGDPSTRHSEKSRTITLGQMLQHTLSEKPLNEEDKVECSACQQQSRLSIRTSIIRFPRVAIFALQRARVTELGVTKSEISIQYPISGLDLRDHESLPATDSAVYSLIGVIHHYGDTVSGHYTAHAKQSHTGKWHLCNDSHISPVSDMAEVVDEREAVLLFYHRGMS